MLGGRHELCPAGTAPFPVAAKVLLPIGGEVCGFRGGGWGVTCASRLCSWPKPTLSVLLNPPYPCLYHPPCRRAFVTLWLTFRYAVNANPARCSLPPVTSLLPQLTSHPAPAPLLPCSCLCDISLTRPLACLISAIVHNFYCACCELVSVTPDELSPLPLPLPLSLLLPMLHCCNFLQFKISAIIDLGHLHLGVASPIQRR